MTAAFDLSGKTCVLTGAAGLLGREFADVLAKSNAQLVVVDQSSAGCNELEEQLVRRYPRTQILAYRADVTNPAEVVALTEAVMQRFGSVYALINNAAIDDKFEDASAALAQSRFESYPLERWQRMLNVNVTGPFLCCQAFGARMAEAGAGSIVNIASTYALVAPQQDLYLTPEGRQAFFKGAAYPTTKSALLGLTRYLASYWGARGVRVNALCPGGVENGQEAFFVNEYAKRTPLRRMAKPTDYRDALAFLVSDASAYMTGANLVIDGGFTTW
jgi:NAD(P)-dependent dehydrogenase (short-subunit alcohol dehydrogenase family)